jgi:glycosyltransferase involved in cell wall biosynthesis
VRAIVLTEHLAAPPHSSGQRRLKHMELSGADVTVAVSRAVADLLSREYGHARETIEVVANGVPPPPPMSAAERARRRASWHLPAGARVWLTVGRLEDQKGVDVLLAAWAALPALLPGPQPHLVVVGEGSRRTELEAQAAALALTDRVYFAGVAGEARTLYRAADGFVLASRFEGMPLALLESMAAGLPVVATAVFGVAEAAGDGTAGEEPAIRIVPPEDPEALARAVADLETRPDVARALGERAATRAAERYGEARMIAAYEALYRRALRLSPAPARAHDAPSEAA